MKSHKSWGSMKYFRNLIDRLPFTLVMLLGLSIAALVTDTYFAQITHHWLNHTGFSSSDLWTWQAGRLFTSALVTIGGKVFWEALLLVAVFVGGAEWLTGSRRTALTFWGVHLLALVLLSLIITLSQHQLREFGLEAIEAARDVGPSAGYFACLGLICSRLKHPWHWISAGILFGMFAVVLFVPAGPGESAEIKFSADLAHLLAFPLGWLSDRLGKSKNVFSGKITDV
jgi:hypothetical protein